MGLHGHVCIEMIQRAIRFFAPIPATFVHPFNLFIATARSLVLLSAGDRNKRIDLDKEGRQILLAELTEQGVLLHRLQENKKGLILN